MSGRTLPPDTTATTRDERLLAGIVAFALFMQNLDGTVITTALPAMARSFGADPVHMNVALTSYLFAVALCIPASGWAADRFGTRRVFAAAVGVFTLGSLFCGLSQSLGGLIAARLLQGAGGAMMLPVGRLVLLRSVPRHRLVSAMAWVTMPALIGPVIGPPVGGLIVSVLSWHWIFYINLPIGIAGMALALVLVPEIRDPAPTRLDVAGLLLSGTALAAFLAFLELVGRGVLPAPALAAILLAAALAGAAYWARARAQPRPLLDFTLLRLPSFAVSVIAGSLFRIGVGAVPFLLPLMLQIGFGRSALSSGMTTFAAAAGAFASKPGAVALLRRFGFRRMLIVNGLVSGLGIMVYAAFRPAWPLAVIYAVLLITGYLRSLQFTSYNTVAYAEVPPERMSAATTLYSALQQMSLTVGIPISAAALHIARQSSAHAAPSPADFSVAFLVIGAFSVLAGPAALLMPHDAGRELSGHQAGEPLEE